MEFNKIKKTDCITIVHLFDKLFGKNFISLETVNSWIGNKNKIAFCYSEKETVIGFIFYELDQVEDLKNSYLSHGDVVSKYFSDCEKIAKLNYIGVDVNYQNRGIASQLFKKSIHQLIDSVDGIVSVCWEKEETNNMRNILINNNFQMLKFIPKYWYNDSIEKNYNCAICGTPPCKCNAEIFALKKPLNF